MIIKRKYSPICRVLSIRIILMGIFFYNCEDTITDIPFSINYGVVINEINYRPSITGDWVELYNPTDETIDIGLWMLKDDNDGHVFTIPENTSLSANDFIVLCKDVAALESQFPQVANFIGDFGFGLSGGGELLRLFDSNEQLVDKVEYNDIAPWPTEPDGNGPTLELINPYLENDMASNWATSNAEGGTPGTENSVYDDK